MKKHLLSILIIFALFISCNKNKKYEVGYHSIKGELIYDSIYSRMPGQFFVLKDYFVWHDPFNSENIIHYIDRHTKKEITAVGNIGQGPLEFTTPALSQTYDNNILVYDRNSSKQAIFITDNIVKKRQEYFIFLEENKMNSIIRKTNIDENTFIVLDPQSEESMFKLLYDNSFLNFGRFFFENAMDKEPFYLYQGFLEYNSDKNKFVYANTRVSYISIYNYDNKDKSIILANEIIEDYEYNSISKKNLIEDREKIGCMGLALSKDFIILQKRDYKSDNINEIDVNLNNFDRMPKTVFLYDYEGKLRHIVNLEMPILRIGANIKENKLYIITTDPEYVIMEYDIDELL